MHIRNLWDPNVDFVTEGQVVGANGKPLRLRTIIARRWGWTKSASYIAADRIELDEHLKGEPWKLYVGDESRKRQQADLFERCDGLLEALCGGLAGRTSREVRSGHPISVMTIRFSDPVVDGGLVARSLDLVASHIGVSSQEEIRERSSVIVTDGLVAVHVEVDGLDVE